MGLEIKKPFSIKDIKDSPFAVVISILIIILFGFLARILVLEKKNDNSVVDCEKEKAVLYDKIITERDKRINMYETLIFYKDKSDGLEEERQVSDSIARKKTGPYVRKILNK